MNHEQLKQQVNHYWNRQSCGVEHTNKEKFSKKYFDEIEEHRYSIEPEIFSFAQFTRYTKKQVLEVGVGSGTDFIQWVRGGALAYGIDLTPESITHVKKRLNLYNMHAEYIEVADAENLPFQDNYFDLAYSWGVIHHSPDTIKCLEELIRVTKPTGQIKVMIYNRHSLFALYRYLAVLGKGKLVRSLSSVIFHHQESIGTKAYTIREMKKILKNYPIKIKSIEANVTRHDLLYYKAKPFRMIAYLAACLFGWKRVGWFMTIVLEKHEHN